MFKQKINLDRHGPEPYPNIWLFPDPPIFSLPTTGTFNTICTLHVYETKIRLITGALALQPVFKTVT